MFNLYQIITKAHGGEAIDTLANQFGLSREQADKAVQALVPSLSTAFMAKAAQPGGVHDMAAAMQDDAHRQAFSEPGAARDPAAGQKGGAIAADIFGNTAILGQVVQQASAFTGISADTLQRMVPVLVSIVMGGVASEFHEQGLGGMLGQLATGGLGNIISHFGAGAGQYGQAGQPASGGFPGMVGTILNSFMGGVQQPVASPAPGPSPRSDAAPRPSATSGSTQSGEAAARSPQDQGSAPPIPPIMQAGLDALRQMFEPGVQASGAQPSDLGNKINASMAEKR